MCTELSYELYFCCCKAAPVLNTALITTVRTENFRPKYLYWIYPQYFVSFESTFTVVRNSHVLSWVHQTTKTPTSCCLKFSTKKSVGLLLKLLSLVQPIGLLDLNTVFKHCIGLAPAWLSMRYLYKLYFSLTLRTCLLVLRYKILLGKQMIVGMKRNGFLFVLREVK